MKRFAVLSITLLIVFILCVANNLHAQSKRVEASYSIELLNPDRMLFIIRADFNFPQKLDSVPFKIENVDNHYSSGYGQFIKNIELIDSDSNKISLEAKEPNYWIARDLKGHYRLSYYVPMRHLSQPSEFGVDETPFFIKNAGVIIGTAFTIYPELELDQIPVNIDIHVNPGPGGIAVLPFEQIDEDSYTVPSYAYIIDSYWAIGNYDSLTIGPAEFPLKTAVQKQAFDFGDDQLFGNLRQIWGELTAIFDHSPEFDPLMIISTYPFSERIPQMVNTGASSPASINILLDEDLKPAQLDGQAGLFVYNLFTQWLPITFFPADRINSNWLITGSANYYQALVPLRTGIISETEFLNRIVSAYEHYSSEYERRNVSVRTARDIPGAQGYVTSAEMLTAIAVDLRLRRTRSSLDQLLSSLAERFHGDTNVFTDQQMFELIDTLSGQFLRPFIDSCLNLKTKIPMPELLRDFGIRLEIIPNRIPDPGMAFRSFTDLTIDRIERNGPAAEAGLEVGDKIVKIDGREIGGVDPFAEYIESRDPGDKIKIEYFRAKSRNTTSLQLGGKNLYRAVKMDAPSETQKERWKNLIGPLRK